MIRKYAVKPVIILLAIILVLYLLSTMVMAAEFSANMTRSMPSQKGVMTMKGKIYVKGMLQRQEISARNGKHITIIRPDKGVIWTLMPEKKSYMERTTAKLNIKSAPSMESSLKKMGDYKKAGTVKIAGYDCAKYTYKDSNRQMSGTVYISSKLQQQLKADTQMRRGKMSYLLSNIKEGRQPDSLFKLPAGYKKITVPMGGMGRGKMMPGMGGMGRNKERPGMMPSPHGKGTAPAGK